MPGRVATLDEPTATLAMSDGARLPESIQTIPEALRYWAEHTPDAPALRSLDWQEASFRELHRAVIGVASALNARGMCRDDRVALILPPGFETCIALLGTMAAAVAVPFHPASTAAELRRDLSRLRPRLLVTSHPVEVTSRAVAAELGIAAIHVDALLAPAARPSHPRADVPPPLPDSTAAILHTSGTTGLPKRVPRSHRTFVAGTRAARAYSGLTPRDVLLLTSGLHTNSGIVNLCAALLTGGACIATTGLKPDRFPHWLDEHQPTWAVSTATELNMILAAADLASRESVAGPRSRLRLVRTGAQPMTPGTAERAEASVRALILDGFGMSEASYITGSGPEAQDRREGACGRPWCTEIRVLDERGADLPPGESGEIVIRGETLFSGYLDDPEANAAAFLPGGWFRTGDLGHLDADGFLSLHGRLHELINRGGEKIAPLEVDRALLCHPAVADAATFAVPDHRLGEDIVAAVVHRPGTPIADWELRAWLLEHLSPAKVPRRIWAVECLPWTPTGKIQRGVLADRFLKRAQRVPSVNREEADTAATRRGQDRGPDHR